MRSSTPEHGVTKAREAQLELLVGWFTSTIDQVQRPADALANTIAIFMSLSDSDRRQKASLLTAQCTTLELEPRHHVARTLQWESTERVQSTRLKELRPKERAALARTREAAARLSESASNICKDFKRAVTEAYE